MPEAEAGNAGDKGVFAFGSGWETLGETEPSNPPAQELETAHLTGLWAELGGLDGNLERPAPRD